MRKIAVALVTLTLVSSAAWADTSTVAVTSGEATAHIYVQVVANIAVGVLTPNVSLGQVSEGTFPAEVKFRIDANVEEVTLSVIATNLYKGDSGASPYFIGLDTSVKADVTPQIGHAKSRADNLLAWTVPTTLNGMLAYQTEAVAFESGQNADFSQDVTVKVQYNQNKLQLPMGEYSGWIKLIATIQP